MRNKHSKYAVKIAALIAMAGAGVVSVSARAQSSPFEKRAFNISNDNRNLMVENSELTLLSENTVQAFHRPPSLALGLFAGSVSLKAQTVRMGKTYTDYDIGAVAAVGLDLKKDLYRQFFGLGLQIEYQTYRNDVGALHIIPVTGYAFGRSRGFTKLAFKGVVEAGYTSAYIRQIGTFGRTGGLGAESGFWQGGVEIPLKTREPWAVGIFYSERFSPESDFDLSGRTIKLQGAITL